MLTPLIFAVALDFHWNTGVACKKKKKKKKVFHEEYRAKNYSWLSVFLQAESLSFHTFTVPLLPAKGMIFPHFDTELW